MKQLNKKTAAKLLKTYQDKFVKGRIGFTTYREMSNFIKGEAR